MRDLGGIPVTGIPVTGGRMVRRDAVVRSDDPERLTAAGWPAVVAPGVRTVVDLRNHGDMCTQLLAPGAAGLRAQDVHAVRKHFMRAAG
ncbi:tyrosine-protein phosphatase [Nonomuraea sp. JJY05]|uniref:tyrosine-protein phosphatase n=1 Tax=Nonomuraea sp. JJY05 TaxID=3350255 RepID=UPI00373E9BB8